PNTKVNTSISDRTIQRPRQSLISAAFKPLDFVFVRPRCGKLRRCHRGLLSGIEKAPTVEAGANESVWGLGFGIVPLSEARFCRVSPSLGEDRPLVSLAISAL